MRPNNGNMFFNRGNGMQSMQGMSGGNCMPGNPGGSMMNGGPGSSGYFPPVNPGQTDLPSVSPRTDKSNICKYTQNVLRFRSYIINLYNVIQPKMIFMFCFCPQYLSTTVRYQAIRLPHWPLTALEAVMEVMEEMVASVFLLLVLRLILEALEWAQQLIPNLLFTMMSNQENFHQTKVGLYVQTVSFG